ncbi:DUF1289 domain-containing protein [Nocardioides marmotae]|uniref:Uncharacterized protein n=1 Tax=Nocardioides marmotae TaxID=2663857 RepID=A0A6I3J1V9_9ACTN|nr:DUF1289 domain-containing protein [Nocardioides marmotae]MCR6031412.1 hypothetical protein [Gordonia jinghuaiqii]MBC9735552.1 DUF1289 domain-containing protein [Nocardioides marmotae]MTB86649.1 hypothetical protein [Nocardioides marmotae]MTB95051.1 hypothetical protein [Nocardioides marmotae]QKE02452.1 DUF1289 domain-containing protein [Nocardioides marmotae]
MTTWSEVKRWSGAKVAEAGEALVADVKVLERANDDLRDRAVPDSLVGLSAWAARIKQRSLVSIMEEHVEGARTYAKAVLRAEVRVSALEEVIVQVEHDAKTQEFAVNGDGSVVDIATPRTFETPRQADAWSQQRMRLLDALVERVGQVLTEALEIDSALEDARPDDAFADAGPQGVVDPLARREWEQMSDEERRAVLEEMTARLAEEYGLEDIDLVIEDLEDRDGDGVDDDPSMDSHGFYRDKDRSVHLDSNELDDPDIINTLAHELRHGMQHEVARDNDPNPIDDGLIGLGIKDDPWDPPPGVSRDDAERWAENFDDYKQAEDDFDAYYNQPVEVDAREAGEDYLEDLTREELEELQEASR